MPRTLATFAAVVLFGALSTAPSAIAAKSTFTIKGRGFGHGVGMSQYGAMGYALHGASARDILAHYYTGTSLGATDPQRIVRVQLIDKTGAARITGAVQAGSRQLDPTVEYTIRRHGLNELTLSAHGEQLATFTAPLQATGQDGITSLRGKGYRGVLEFAPGLFGGVSVVNAVSLEDYLQGVVPAESPSSWPAAALQAQAIAARTYAITTARGGTFDQYADTRSQVYGGVSVETPATNQAVADTRGQVVTYQGQPVTTYFFSTSGGKTEDVENSFVGSQPKPWLKAVDDPFDAVSPKHRWGPFRFTAKQVQSKLRRYLHGRYKRIKVLQRGVSPRVVRAQVVGTGGVTDVTGPQLRSAFGLFDTWAFFTTVTSKSSKPKPKTPAAPPQPPAPTGDPSGGVSPIARAAAASAMRVEGTIAPARPGRWLAVQRKVGTRWVTAVDAHVGRGGRYSVAVPGPGVYRVVYGKAVGPDVRVG